MGVVRFDHVSIPTDDAERLLAFYRRVGFATEGEAEWRAGTHPTVSVRFADCKINVHPETMRPMRGESWYLRPPNAEPGCGDICVEWDEGIDALVAMLSAAGVEITAGPMATPGSRPEVGHGVSVYVRDPDDNLLEFISYAPDDRERFPRRRRG